MFIQFISNAMYSIEKKYQRVRVCLNFNMKWIVSIVYADDGEEVGIEVAVGCGLIE